MKYLIVEPKLTSVANNIALMKWARWCENNGYEYQYVRGMVKPKIQPDKILMSCIFSYYSKKYEQTIDYYLRMFPNVKILVGGVFPTLSPEWFNKDKWIIDNGIFEPSKRVEIHCGMNHDIEMLPPKFNVDIYDEADEKDDLEEHKDNLMKSSKRADSVLIDRLDHKADLREKRREKRKRSRNTIVLYSSRGCVNKCGYCAVPRLEGDMKSFKSISHILDAAKKELPNAKSVVLYDNNFTAHQYWDKICDELIEFGLPVDIHGLHVDSFTPEMAQKFTQMTWGSQGKENSTAYLRFSFDKMKYRDNIGRALTYYMDAGLNKKVGFFLYMLFNYVDSPHDFWTRLVYAQKYSTEFGTCIMMFPQRYEPFQALEKYQYVGKKWTPELAAGVRKLSTWLHGFLTLSPNGNLFRWIGYSEEEFLQKVYDFATVKGYRLEKNEDNDPPSYQELIDKL